MTGADLPLGMRLKGSNGWNQTEADWRRYVELQPDRCFVAVLDDTPVGTLTTCIFGPVAWVGLTRPLPPTSRCSPLPGGCKPGRKAICPSAHASAPKNWPGIATCV